MLLKLLQGIIDVLVATLNLTISFLPASPFKSFMNFSLDNDMIGAMNYFLPISEIISVLQAWLVAVTVYYIWMTVGRWVKIID